MNRFILISFLSLLGPIAKSQDSVVFTLFPLPDKIYSYHKSFKMIGKVEVEGSYLPEYKVQIAIPNVQTAVEADVRSALLTKREIDGRIPYEWKFTKALISQKYNRESSQLKDPLSGTVVYGFYDTRSKAKTIDSLSNSKLSSFETFSLQLRLDDYQVNFPNKAIAIGSSFENQSTFNFPILGGQQHFNITTKYSLLKIYHDIAYLETSSSFDVESNDPAIQIEVLPNTKGSGILTYDIKNHCIIKNTSEYALFLKVKKDGHTVLSKIWSKSLSTTTVKQNNNS